MVPREEPAQMNLYIRGRHERTSLRSPSHVSNTPQAGTQSTPLAESSNAPVSQSLRTMNTLTRGPPTCTICLSPITDKADLQPCNHSFDLECIRHWVAATSANARKCPLCRHEIIALQYTSNGQKVREAVEQIDPHSALMAHVNAILQGLSLDEEVNRQNRRVARMSQWRGLAAVWEFNTCLQAFMNTEDRRQFDVRRYMDLRITQTGVHTKTVFQRMLFIVISKLYPGNRGHNETPGAREHVDRALDEVRLTLAQLGLENLPQRRATIDLTLPPAQISRDRRGIHSELKEKVQLKPGPDGDMIIKWDLELNEELQARHLPSNSTEDSNASEERILRARDMIQAAEEWFRSIPGSRYGRPAPPLLERRTTNIREVREVHEECDLCHQRHRWRDCMLGWHQRVWG